MRSFRTLAVVALPLVLSFAAVSAVLASDEDPAPAPTTVEDLAWLAGTWRAEGAFEEHWTAPSGGTLVAVSREFRGAGTAMVELSEITLDGDSLVLRLRHFRAGLTPWESEKDGPLVWRLQETGENRVVFSEPTRDFPRSITYQRKDDVLTATLAGERDGEPIEMAFDLKRAK